MHSEISESPYPHAPPVTPDDRRASARASTVLLIGKVDDGQATSACMVLNLSESGLMARVSFVARVGQRVTVELRGLPPAVATIRWVAGNNAGMQFDHPQNLNPVFCQIGDDGQVARAPRFAVSMDATIRLASCQFPARVVNISPGGVRLAADAQIECGQTGQIVMPGQDVRLFGTVRWVERNEFGFHFSTPLPLSALRKCLTN